MKKIVLLAFVLSLLPTAVFVGFVRPAVAQETIYIKSGGSVDPQTAPIQRDGNVYTFTDNIYDSIVVQRDNIVVDGADYTLQGTGNGKGIDLTGRSNVTAKNMRIEAFDDGIYLDGSSNNTLSGNNITNNTRGIWLYDSSNNSISGNNITNNRVGVWLRYSSNNTISGNNITNNYYYGIRLEDSSSSNNISGNDIANNKYYGIYIHNSSNNKFYHNRFINNTYQVYLYQSLNVWNEGYPSGGNYWSDYVDVDQYSGPNQNETGSDEIWDHPYVIDEGNQDNYPIVPEFPTWTSMLLILIVLTVAIAIYKRRLLEKPIQ